MDRRRPYSCKSEPACWRAFYICNGWRLFPVYVPARTKFIALVVIARNKMDAGLNKNLRCLLCNDSRMSNSCRVRNVLRIIFIRNFVTTYRFRIRHCDWRSRSSKIESGEDETRKIVRNESYLVVWLFDKLKLSMNATNWVLYRCVYGIGVLENRIIFYVIIQSNLG